MAEGERPSHDQSTTLSRRDFLKAIGVTVGALALSPERAEAQTPPSEVVAAFEQLVRLRREPITFGPYKGSIGSLEPLLVKFLQTTSVTNQQGISYEQAVRADQELFTALAPLDPQRATEPYSPLRQVERMQLLAKQLAAKGVYLEYLPNPRVAKGQSGVPKLVHFSVIPGALRRITHVEEAKLQNFWDGATLSYQSVELGAAHANAAGRAYIAPSTEQSGHADFFAAHGAMLSDSLMKSQAAEVRRNTRRVLEDEEARGFQPSFHEVVQRIARNPEQASGLAMYRMRSVVRDAYLALPSETLDQLDRTFDTVHEASHIFFDRDAAYREIPVFSAETKSGSNPQRLETELLADTVRAEVHGMLGELIYGTATVARDHAWLPLFETAVAASQRQQDPTHGLAADWILGEFVQRVVADPDRVGLDFSNIPTEQQSATVWASLGEIALKTEPATLREYWQDIAASYRASLGRPFVNESLAPIQRPLNQEFIDSGDGLHPSWGILTGIATGAAALFGLAKWRQNRMEAQRQRAIDEQRSAKKRPKR